MSFLLLLHPVSAIQPGYQVVTCHYDNVPFGEFCADLQARTGVQIFFSGRWTDSLLVTIHTDSLTLFQAVEKVVAPAGLSVSEWNGHLVVLNGKMLPEVLPEFDTDLTQPDWKHPPDDLTESEAKYLTGRKANDLPLIRVGNLTGAFPASRVKIVGRISEAETGEAIIGATMYLEELGSGAISDQAGILNMVVKPGIYQARFEFLGFEKKPVILEVLSSGEFGIELQKTVIPIGEVVIIGDRQISVVSRDPGLEKISTKIVREIPTMMGERDILKVSEMLPGIVSVGEGSAGLNVRGGGSDQNVFYINKIPVYNTSHLFGFFPAFHSDLVKDFSIYKGYVPPEYGGRLSSVFDLITRQGNRKQFSARGGINPVSGNLTLEGPWLKDKGSLLVSARSSYSDWILKRIQDPLISSSSAGFYDLAVSMNLDAGKNRFTAFGFHSHDNFRLSDINTYNYSNHGISLGVKRQFSPDLHGEFTLIGSRYAFGTQDRQEPTMAYSQSYLLEHYEARMEFKHLTLTNHSVTYGASVLLNGLDRGLVNPFSTASQRDPVDLGHEKGLDASLFLSDQVSVFSWLNVSAGLRYGLYMPLGPSKSIRYLKGAPIDTRFVSDTVVYENNRPIRYYQMPDFRISVNFSTGSEGAVKLAFNQMHQALFMLNNTISVAPNTQWKLADYHLKPAQSNQVSAGYFRNFAVGGWETSAEAFFKISRHFPEFKDGADFINGDPVETIILQGNQKAYGVELSVKRTGHKVNGWFAYTWSRSFVEIDGGESWNSINGGKAYPSNYDIPHAMNALVNYQMSRRLGISSVLSYQTGRPITYPLSVYYIDGLPYTDYSTRNQFNIPDYFRMDLSVTVEGNLKKNKPMHSSFVFSVYNLTGRKNPYSVYFRSEYGRLASYKYSVIGVPFYSFTWIFKMGNYAAD